MSEEEKYSVKDLIRERVKEIVHIYEFRKFKQEWVLMSVSDYKTYKEDVKEILSNIYN